MTIKTFIISCIIWAALGLLANVFSPAGYTMMIISIVVGPIILYGFFRGIYNMIQEHNKMKAEREANK